MSPLLLLLLLLIPIIIIIFFFQWPPIRPFSDHPISPRRKLSRSERYARQKVPAPCLLFLLRCIPPHLYLPSTIIPPQSRAQREFNEALNLLWSKQRTPTTLPPLCMSEEEEVEWGGDLSTC